MLIIKKFRKIHKINTSLKLKKKKKTIVSTHPRTKNKIDKLLNKNLKNIVFLNLFLF